jgi:hypothetical protein
MERTYKQSDINFVNNLANIIFENELKILAEVKHSPEMYSILLEQDRKHTRAPLDDQIIISVFNELQHNENFVKETYHILSKQELTEAEKNIITKHIMTEGLGRVLRAIGKWLFKTDTVVPVIRTKGPRGRWVHLEGPERPFTPGVNYEPRGPAGSPTEWVGPIPTPLTYQYPIPKP